MYTTKCIKEDSKGPFWFWLPLLSRVPFIMDIGCIFQVCVRCKLYDEMFSTRRGARPILPNYKMHRIALLPLCTKGLMKLTPERCPTYFVSNELVEKSDKPFFHVRYFENDVTMGVHIMRQWNLSLHFSWQMQHSYSLMYTKKLMFTNARYLVIS